MTKKPRAMNPVQVDSAFEGRMWSAGAWVVCFVSVSWLAVGFLVGAQIDDEEYWHSIVSTLIAAQGFQRGELDLWTSQLGLGMPQPFGQSLFMHPLTPLLGFMPVVLWVKSFYLIHLVVAAGGMWLLLRRVGASKFAAAIGVSTYILASPAQNYALRDFWPSLWSVYTLVPTLLFSVLVLCQASSPRSRLLGTLGVGLTAGLIGAVGHWGNLVVFVPSYLSFLALQAKQLKRNWLWWVLAATTALVIASPILANLIGELRLSPSILERGINVDTLNTNSLWDVFLRPFGPPSDDWVQTTLNRGVRILFFGGPAALLAVFYVVVLRTRVDLCVGWLVALLLLTVPGLLVTDFVSAVWQFRDALILFAVPCAALALDWVALRSVLWRWVAIVVAAIQLVVLVTAAWPFIALNLDARKDPVTGIFVGDRSISSWLRDYVGSSGGRVYYSAGVDRLLWNQELSRDGLWRNSMFYRNVPVVNASFKFTAMEPVASGGSILGLPEVTSGDLTLLDLAGVRWVLARADEVVSSVLIKRAERMSSGGVRLFLYEYPPARGAVFVNSAVQEVALPPIPGCTHVQLFCWDFSRLAPFISQTRAHVSRENGRVMITFDPADRQRMLLVGEMFRPGWRAVEAGLTVEPVFGALVGVAVPAGSSQVTLRFMPLLRFVLTFASWATMLLATGALLMVLIWVRDDPC